MMSLFRLPPMGHEMTNLVSDAALTGAIPASGPRLLICDGPVFGGQFHGATGTQDRHPLAQTAVPTTRRQNLAVIQSTQNQSVSDLLSGWVVASQVISQQQ